MNWLRTLVMLIIMFPLCGSANETNDSSRIVYQSGVLIITQLTNNVYIHTSFFHSETFGKVPCNGMIVTSQNEAVVFDTPANDTSSAELINWLKHLDYKIKAVVPTHFHQDCVGGLNEFHKHNVPSYANQKTIALAKGRGFNVPQNGFSDSLVIPISNNKVNAAFIGEGHTQDNIVGYFHEDGVLFGGCLIKELNAGKGNLEDANVVEWSNTVKKLKSKYPEVKIVIPGHGMHGDPSLLDYTISLFNNTKRN